MSLLLVDDRDGRIVAEIEREEQLRAILESWACDDGTIPSYLCLVEVTSRHGPLVATDSSVKVRPLS